ncbi:MAG: DUF1573 domain-containing protein [Bacteroidetes bacterium]|nr:DUF1573 domain-containing protein [Bacteroidota bacterium]
MKKFLYILLITGTSAIAQEKPNPPAPKPQVNPNASPTAAEITFEELSHDFGTVKKGSSIVYKFKYKNTGKEALVINECRAGCGCTKPHCSKEPLKHGKSDYIEVHYDSTRVGNFAKEVTISSNAKTPLVNLVIRGMVVEETEGTDAPAKDEEKMKSNENKK